MTIYVILLSFICLTISAFYFHVKRRRHDPPGPLGLPFIGSIPFRIKDLIFTKWLPNLTEAERYKSNKEKYGPIWSVKYGNQRIVVLSSWDIINEAFIDNAELFSGKPNNDMYKLFGQSRGILLGNGQMWQGHRRLAMRSLKDLGMGRKKLENKISEEADKLIEYLRRIDTEDFNLLDLLIKCVANIAIHLVFLERHGYSDPSFTNYANCLRFVNHSEVFDTKLILSSAFFQTYLLKKCFPDVPQFLKANQFCMDFIKDKCTAREQIQQEISQPECLFDFFFKFRFPDASILAEAENEAEILQSMCDIFSAAIDTVSNYLSFCFLFLGRYEDLQDDLRNEIRTVTNRNGSIDLNDRKSCPKVLSFLDEVQRVCCIVPKVHHRVIKECVFRGYKLYPTDVVYGDLANLFLSPDLFKNPGRFDPYRFTNESHTKYSPSKYLIPFGIGKRSCLGESMAKMESFMLLIKIVDKFQITLTSNTLQNFDNVIRGYSGILRVPLGHHLNLRLLNV